MRIPAKPPVGCLIAYEYLWRSQAGHREDGAKTYPAAIVIARHNFGPVSIAYAVALSHSPPREMDRALPVPPKLKRHLGLDAEPSWIYTDQINVFGWPGPDLRPADHLSSLPGARDGCVIGPLPADWFNEVKQHLEESIRLGLVKLMQRTP